MATTKNIQSIERAFSLLETFQSVEGSELSLKDLSEALHLNKSTTFGLANTLVNLGYLRRNEHSQQYSLGLKFLSFSDTVQAQSLILQAVHPYLIELSRKYNHTAHCAVQKGDKVVYLDKVTAPQSISINSQIGQENWMHCTGVGKCILAWMPQQNIARILSSGLPAKTKNTITQPEKLQRELEKIREQGYALDTEEIELGLSCIAVPVFSPTEKICCAISISGLSPRISVDVKNGAAEELKKISREITARL